MGREEIAMTPWARGEAAEPIDWEAVYRAEMPRIYNFFRYRLGDRDLAEDLTALTFEKAWRHRRRYRHELAKYSTWLYSIARNVATDHLRKHQPAVLDLDALTTVAGGGPDPTEAAQWRDDMGRLAALLGTLPHRDADLIALKYGAGLTNRAIAQLTGLSESNVGTILHRVVQKLREVW